tara:strand:- start:44 stop:244 length:201 start_codon:yes stop_codon:yes gene_type:complete
MLQDNANFAVSLRQDFLDMAKSEIALIAELLVASLHGFIMVIYLHMRSSQQWWSQRVGHHQTFRTR